MDRRRGLLAALTTFLALVGVVLAVSVPGSAGADAGTAPAPGPSSAIAMTPDGDTLLVVNPDSNSLTLVSAASRSVLAELTVGVTPRAVALSPDGGVAYVANEGSDTVTVVDVERREVAGHVAVGDRPVGVAVAPQASILAIAELGSDRIRFVDTDTLRTLSVAEVRDRPYGLSFTPDSGWLLVSHLLDGRVTVLAVRPFRLYLPLIMRSLAAGDAAPAIVSAPVPFHSFGFIAGEIATWPNVAPAPSVVVGAAGDRAYLPQTMAHGQGRNTEFDTTVIPKVSVVDLTAGVHVSGEDISLPGIDR